MTNIKQSFDWPVVGHRNIVDFLQKSLANNRVSHAYLFCGPEHIGKTTVAENFAASLVCQKKSGTVPCRECAPCRQFFQKIHPDLYFIEKESGKKNISINQIRDLRHKLSMCSFLDSYKIALIQDAETLNREAFNSFLKTLEEPSEKTVIILIARNTNYFPKTILSRCQIMKFLPVSTEEIFKYLKQFFNLGDKKANELASLSMGRPGAAIDFLRQDGLLEDYQGQVSEFMKIATGTLSDKFQMAGHLFGGAKFLENVGDCQKKLSVWSLVVRDLILIKNSAGNFIAHDFAREELTKLAGRYSGGKLLNILAEISKTQKYLSQNVNPRLAVENLVLYLAS